MAFGISTNRYGGGDDRWLGSRHGVDNAQTATLKASAFSDKLVKSGTPIKRGTDGLYEPGNDAPEAFVIGDQSIVDGDSPVPALWHGRILVDFLPVADFAIPAEPGAFVYVKEA